MKKIIKPLVTLFLIINSSANLAEEFAPDPYQSIEFIKLDNGMSVYFSPSEDTNLTSIRLEVDVGWEIENKTNWGVSHLLEHVLFRDKQLKEEMSYLQIIKEAGGSANGTTENRKTSFFGSIPYSKGSWLLENFSKMILEPKIINEYVQKEKSTVELEIGRPGPVEQILGINPGSILNPGYLHRPSFWEREFGIEDDKKFTPLQEQLSNQKLTVVQVQKHYKDYYYPSNMRLFIAGKFDRKIMMDIINKSWATNKSRTGLKIPPLKVPTPRNAPYVQTGIGMGSSSVYLGTKASGLTLKEKEVLNSYTNYLAHKIMKELRNRLGQTYTASSTNIGNGTYGFTYVNFKTPEENLKKNLKVVKNYIDHDATKGLMSAEQVNEAIDLTLSKYHLRGREADAMMGFARDRQSIQYYFGEFQSPYKILKNTSPKDYNNILKKYFTPNNAYEVIEKPAILFPYDYMFFYAFVAMFTFSILRSFLTKEFKNDHIRWVRKVKYPPLKMLEGIAVVCSWYVFLHLAYLLNNFIFNTNFIESNLFLNHYLAVASLISLFFITVQMSLSFLPRKLMVMDDQLVIKSVSYYSKKIPLSQIENVETMRAIALPLKISKMLVRIGFRYHFYDMKFWKEGLIVNLKNGNSYFFSVESAENAHRELSQFLSNPNKSKSSTDIAA